MPELPVTAAPDTRVVIDAPGMNTAAARVDATTGAMRTLRHEVRTLAALDALWALRPLWDDLAERADACPPSLAWPYCELAAERAFASGATLMAALVFDGDRLVALWPVSVSRKGALRVAQGLGCGSGEEYGGPLVADTTRPELYDAVLAALRDSGAHTLEVRMLQHGTPLQEALTRVPQSWVIQRLPTRWRGLPGYAIALGRFDTYDSFLASLPKSLRSNLRYCAKRLGNAGETEYGWCTTPDDAARVLTWLFANKRRWAVERGIDTPYLMDDAVRDFFIALAARIDLKTTPLVSFVKVNGAPVAASVNLVGDWTIEYFITTYDDAYAAHSVGSLLVDSVVRWALAHRRDFDFRPLFADYKARWSNVETWHESHLVMLRPLGRIAEVPLAFGAALRVLRKLQSVAAARLQAKRGAANTPRDNAGKPAA